MAWGGLKAAGITRIWLRYLAKGAPECQKGFLLGYHSCRSSLRAVPWVLSPACMRRQGARPLAARSAHFSAKSMPNLGAGRVMHALAHAAVDMGAS